MNLSENSWIGLDTLSSKSAISTQSQHYISSSSLYDLEVCRQFVQKKPLVAWTNCMNRPRATSRWKKCLDSRTKSDKPDRSATSEKEAPRTIHTSRTRGTSQTSTSLSQKGPDLSITHPWQPIALRSLRKLSTWRYLSSYLRRNLLGRG